MAIGVRQLGIALTALSSFCVAGRRLLQNTQQQVDTEATVIITEDPMSPSVIEVGDVTIEENEDAEGEAEKTTEDDDQPQKPSQRFRALSHGDSRTKKTVRSGQKRPSSARAVAHVMNRYYERHDDGVFLRLIDPAGGINNDPWICCMSKEQPGCARRDQVGTFSFGLINYMAWNKEENRQGLYGESDDMWGYIGTGEAYQDTVTCVYPGDGGTMNREHAGCGCPTICNTKGADKRYVGCTGGCKAGWDWCDQHKPPLNSTGHFGCVLRPTELRTMFSQYEFYQTKEAKAIDEKYDIEHFVEVIVDGKRWNTKVCQNIRAFVLLDACWDKSSTCYKTFATNYKKYNDQCGLNGRQRPPVVKFSMTKKLKPFSAYE